MGFEKSGYRDGIFHSLLRPIPTPRNVDMVTYILFQQPHPQRTALVDSPTGASVSYAQLQRRVRAVASGLARKGVKQGDVVMLCMPNSIHWPVLLFASSFLGAVVTTANPVNSIPELRRQAQDCRAAFLITVPEHSAKLAPLGLPTILNDLDALGVASQVEVAGAPAPVARLSELLRADPDRASPPFIRESDTALLLYSSGTTGASKGVVLTHLNVVESISQRDSLDCHLRVPDEIETHLVIIPLFHVMGLCVVLATLLRRSHKLVIVPKFDFPSMLAAVQRYKVTNMGLVPPIMVALTKSPLVSQYDLSSLKVIGYGAAPSGDVSGVAQRIKGVKLTQGYGMTETAGSGAAVSKDFVEYALERRSCGFLTANMQAKIVDVGTGEALPPNREGELWLHGLNVMRGYLNNEKATAETLDKDGWLHTGDLAKFDENGFLYIVDRLKELIKYNGFQVAPAELESVLLNHPEIVDTAVVPFPEETVGEIPVAFVVKRPGSSLTADAVMDYVAEQVSPYKKVRRVVFVDIIPKLESGPDLCSGMRAGYDVSRLI
ncbi:hypothetical protein AXG93_219s1020 [Marchantia polymorpha subsp. ruderalis]|uniref:4-coumarate--CoA ligase n=1 Tax=Marchantia polymorpha subsp. ruderalis TaxID=1480154 RepID=A0A176WHW4_MARPO|nr:hypothetical protein AXG93_219s1020 [Marchantia polymorpha subsp. ruderalis]